jgi:cytochrome c oxidase subunit 2
MHGAVVETRQQYDAVWSVYLPIAAGVFAIVVLTLLFFLWRYRARRDPARTPGRTVAGTFVEGSYVLLLGLITAFLLYWTLSRENRVDAFANTPPAATADVPTIDVVAARWTWRFAYRGTGVQQLPPADRGPTTLVVPADTPVRFAARSQDVLHDFWVPDVKFQRQVWPDHVEEWTLAFPPGRHQGICAWFCGLDHQNMHFVVDALAPERFAAWLRERREGAPR